MIKLATFIEQHKEGKVSDATMIKMAAFKNELEKTGAGTEFLTKALEAMKHTVPNVIAGGATIGLGALIYEGIKGVEKAWTGYKLDAIKEPKFLEMLELHPELKEKPARERAALYFDSLWHFSPSMAQNPLAAGSYIKQALQMHHVAQGPLPELVQKTTEIQRNIKGGLPTEEYSTPMGAVFLSLKPQSGAAYKGV